jgi:hypothetical protein
MRPENEKNKPVIEASTTSKKDQPSESSQEALDNTWAELTQDWQSQPYEKVDVQALLSQTKAHFLGEILISFKYSGNCLLYFCGYCYVAQQLAR